MTRYLIAGAGGMLGTALQRVLDAAGRPYVAPAEHDFDITDESSVRAVVGAFAQGEGAGVLVNAAAYTNVDGAEDNAELAYRVNELGARLLAEAARDAGLAFVHVSTDFVFDGTKAGAYAEDDAPNPLSVYGASKLAGEVAVLAALPSALVVRTAWVYGPGGANFPTKILELAHRMPSLKVVTDEIGSPTYTLDLAAGMLALLDVGASGIFHLAGSGACSRYELAAEVLRHAGLDNPIEPVTADAFPTKAARPKNSVLDCAKAAALGVRLPDWHASLAAFVTELARS